jgi:hypothetical protein
MPPQAVSKRREGSHIMIIDFRAAEKFRGTQIYRQATNLAYAYETTFKAVDADGAPNAYNPDDTGLDRLSMRVIRIPIGGRTFWSPIPRNLRRRTGSPMASLPGFLCR